MMFKTSAFSLLSFVPLISSSNWAEGWVPCPKLSWGFSSSLSTQYSINLAWHLFCLSGAGHGKHVRWPQVGSLDPGCGCALFLPCLASFGKLSFVSNVTTANVSQWSFFAGRVCHVFGVWLVMGLAWGQYWQVNSLGCEKTHGAGNCVSTSRACRFCQKGSSWLLLSSKWLCSCILIGRALR